MEAPAPVEAVKVQEREPLTGYEEIEAALEILLQVRKDNVRWLPEMFSTVLYGGTPLARGGARHVGLNEVLWKNLYYLAKNTQNVPKELIVSLVNGDVLTKEEGDLITQHHTNVLRAVKMYALLVQKEDPDEAILTSVSIALRDFENNDVLKIFEDHDLIHVNQNNGAAAEQREAGGREDIHEENEANAEENQAEDDVDADDNQEDIEDGEWACRYCTFVNNAESNICEMCAKTVDFNLDDSIDFNICPQCTLMNDRAVEICDACGFEFQVLGGQHMPVGDQE